MMRSCSHARTHIHRVQLNMPTSGENIEIDIPDLKALCTRCKVHQKDHNVSQCKFLLILLNNFDRISQRKAIGIDMTWCSPFELGKHGGRLLTGGVGLRLSSSFGRSLYVFVQPSRPSKSMPRTEFPRTHRWCGRIAWPFVGWCFHFFGLEIREWKGLFHNLKPHFWTIWWSIWYIWFFPWDFPILNILPSGKLT